MYPKSVESDLREVAQNYLFERIFTGHLPEVTLNGLPRPLARVRQRDCVTVRPPDLRNPAKNAVISVLAIANERLLGGHHE